MIRQDEILDESQRSFITVDLRILEIPLTTEAFRMYAELKRYANWRDKKCFQLGSAPG